MYFLFVKLMNTDYKEDVILALQSVGVTKASYIECQDLEKSLSDEFHLFTGFFGADRREGENGIVTALVESKDQVSEVVTNLRDAGIDIDGEEILRLIAWPVEMVFDSGSGFTEY